MARILIVDDDDNFRAMLRTMLERGGHVVTEAIHGRAAMPIVEKQPLDLAIVDLIMPEKEGMETIPEIHKLRPNIKILAVSGGGRMASKDLLKMTKLLGAHKTLAKPFTREELDQVLLELIGPPPKKD
jgi:CheY-like chemotaxis protein